MIDPDDNSEIAREVIDAKRRLEGIVASAMDAIITVDETHHIVLFNPAAEQMFRVTTSDALGQPIERFIPHRYRAGHQDHIRRFGTTGVTGRRMGALGAISGLRADGEEFPVEASISQVDVGHEHLFTVILRDITERKANEEARQLLAREVDHRAKNALAVVQALVSLTTASSTEDFIEAVTGRVSALARAHSLLAENRWKGAALQQIVGDETGAYARTNQVECDGPDVTLMPNAVQPISLVLHELATNAVKYGSLSREGGRVMISWRVKNDGRLELRWLESGGPTVVEPSKSGFGSTLIQTVAARQLGGRVNISWHPDGVRVSANLPSSTFTMSNRTDTELNERTRERRPEAVQTGRILLVEDEALIGMEMARAFENEGWEVVGPAGTIEEAFQLLSIQAKLDVAVLDINLNGKLVFPVADLLASRGIPFLFCSGHGSASQDARYDDRPIIRKPASMKLLLNALREILIVPGKQMPSML